MLQGAPPELRPYSLYFTLFRRLRSGDDHAKSNGIARCTLAFDLSLEKAEKYLAKNTAPR